MKQFTLLFILCLLTPTMSFGQTRVPETHRPELKIRKDSANFKKYRQQLKKFNDKLKLRDYEQFADSLKEESYISPDLLKKWQERNKQPLDTMMWRNSPRLPNMSNQQFKTDSTQRPYITRAELDNMPIYVPEKGYIPNVKVESNDNMPVKKLDKKDMPSVKPYLLNPKKREAN